MSWLKKLLPTRIKTEASDRRGVPEGVWSKCDACKAVLYHAELVRNLFVCPKCAHHQRIPARQRLALFFDEGNYLDLTPDRNTKDILKFKDSKRYKDRLSAARKATREKEALLIAKGTMQAVPVVLAAFNFQFMGGSMGAIVGETFVFAIQKAVASRCPLICFTSSGGARMQEGLTSLMQMAKTAAALTRLTQTGLPYISVLTDPTMGGVSASLAMLGDLILAEPNALIGFAGPRVIEQTVRQKLPEGFQKSEFLLAHGHIDQVVDRRALKERLVYFMQQCLFYQSINT